MWNGCLIWQVLMWNAAGAGSDPSDLSLEFSWTGTESEAWFSAVQANL